MGLLLLLIPLVSIGLFWITSNRTFINISNSVGSFLLLLVSGYMAYMVIVYKSVSYSFFNNMFYIDSISCLMLIITTFISFLVSVYSMGYMNEEYRRKIFSKRKFQLFYSLLHAFILTMIVSIVTQNMGVMWIAIESTTLASAFLVGFYNNKKSIEAAWKYIIICSVGIAFALLGIIMLYYSSISTLNNSPNGLNWRFLFDNASMLQGSILKISFIFILIGFGTKAGLAPMHTWLPDAHSQAPSPVSALLSGVLLNTAMYGIIRVMILVNKNLASNIFTGRLLIVFGLISIGTASIFVLVQQDFKRTLAYSSIEHIGIITFGIGILSPLSIFAALYHTLNHALTKSMLFIASGNVYLKYDTKKINKVQGVLKTMPVTGVVFLLGIFAITGMPPFSIFSSELNIVVAAFKDSHYVSTILILCFLTVVFTGFVTQLAKMFYGKPANKEIRRGEIDSTGPVVLVILLVIVTVTGLYLPPPLKTLIESARDIILGG